MAKYKGCEGVVIVDTDQILELSGFSIDQAVSAVDASVLGKGGVKEVLPGQSSWSGSIDVFYDPDDAGIIALVPGKMVVVEFYPAGQTSGRSQYTGTGLVTSISTPVETDGMIKQSFSIEGSGALIVTQTAMAAFSKGSKKENSENV